MYTHAEHVFVYIIKNAINTNMYQQLKNKLEK